MAVVNILYSILYKVYYNQVDVANVPLQVTLPCMKEPLRIETDNGPVGKEDGDTLSIELGADDTAGASIWSLSWLIKSREKDSSGDNDIIALQREVKALRQEMTALREVKTLRQEMTDLQREVMALENTK